MIVLQSFMLSSLNHNRMKCRVLKQLVRSDDEISFRHPHHQVKVFEFGVRKYVKWNVVGRKRHFLFDNSLQTAEQRTAKRRRLLELSFALIERVNSVFGRRIIVVYHGRLEKTLQYQGKRENRGNA